MRMIKWICDGFTMQERKKNAELRAAGLELMSLVIKNGRLR